MKKEERKEDWKEGRAGGRKGWRKEERIKLSLLPINYTNNTLT